jgi:hypothetical protein
MSALDEHIYQRLRRRADKLIHKPEIDIQQQEQLQTTQALQHLCLWVLLSY